MSLLTHPTSTLPHPALLRGGIWALRSWDTCNPPCQPRNLCVARAASEDATIRVKIGLASNSGRLDLSELQLTEVPGEVFQIRELEDLTLAGNNLKELPDALDGLPCLRRLQLAGNQLRSLPNSITCLTALEGLWLHGNLLGGLPEGLGCLTALRTLSLASNRLPSVPASLGNLTSLEELALAGNQLSHLPASLSSLVSLTKLTLNGNRLKELPCGWSGLTALQELSLQGNLLEDLPPDLCLLQGLQELNLADNLLRKLPDCLNRLAVLRTLYLYGNCITHLPPGLTSVASLSVWAEGNPLEPAGLGVLLRALDNSRPAGSTGKLGLDVSQTAGVADWSPCGIGESVVVGEVVGRGIGYFKLQHGALPGQAPIRPDGAPGDRLLVVAFGSAPGEPNWGGLLKRVAAAAEDTAEAAFDVLYVVDPARTWYGGGDERYETWAARIQLATKRYKKVLMLGDSMGGTAALLFSHLATAVHAFTPQIDLVRSSIRPSEEPSWQEALKDRLLANVGMSGAHITAYSGTWQHDVDQMKDLPASVEVKIFGVDSHRVALWLDSQKRLLPILRSALLSQMGLPAPPSYRTANLL